MLKNHLRLICIFVIVASVFLTVYAGLHFRGAAGWSSGSLVAVADISGFGNNTGTVTVTLRAWGSGLTAFCQNRGGNLAPGQNPVNVNVSTSQVARPDKNGSATVTFHVNLLPSTRAAGCPNGNWRVVDLIGTINASLEAVDSATGASDRQDYVCQIHEALQQVDCVLTSG
jgi:hypothetical protein